MNVHMLVFDNTNSNWTDGQIEANLMFLRAFENHFNQLLRIRGRLFRNDVYERLGFPLTREGQVEGWYLDVHHPNHPNMVHFALHLEREERQIKIVFSDQGNILDQLPKEAV